VIRRRTTLFYRGLADERVERAVEQLLSSVRARREPAASERSSG